jgi:HlyD family secretion protein
VSRRDGAAAELEAAEAGVARARASVRLAREELDHLVVRAPFDGVVTQRYVEVGESVIPGQPVLEVMSPDSLYVSAPIDEIDIGRIREGLPARISLDPYPGRSWPGRVTRVAPYVDDLRDQNRTLEVEVEVIEAGSVAEAKPGTSADVELILDVRENVLRAPTFSVIEGKRVLVIEEGKAAVRNVTIGLRNWEWTEIREGLAEGELVITNLDKQGVVAGARVVAAGAREAP